MEKVPHAHDIGYWIGRFKGDCINQSWTQRILMHKGTMF